YAEVPPRVEYSITERTRSLFPHINSLIGWAKENMVAILKDRAGHRNK
ncbi:winged helix-turn-helix transcriptional regulator, partial [uncultured Duncaniella sp.]